MKSASRISLEFTPRTAELFLVPSDTLMGAYHKFSDPEPLKRSEADEHYRLGVEIAHQEYPDFAAARAHMLDALRYRPEFVEALVALGDIERNPYNPSVNGDAAERAYERALELDANAPQALLGRLNVLIDKALFAEAEAAYSDLLIRHPRFMKYSSVERYEAEAHPPFGWYYPRMRNLQLLKRLGDAYYVAKRHLDAVERYGHILNSDSRDVEVRLARAFSYFRAGAVDDAEAAFRELLDNPGHIDSALTRYRIWFVNNLVVPAVDAGHKPSPEALRMSARNQLGIIQLGRGRADEAIEIFGEVGACDEIVNNIGVASLSKGEIDRAERFFEQSRCPEAAYNLALIREAQRRWADAAAFWEVFLDRDEKELNQKRFMMSRRYVASLDRSWYVLGKDRLGECRQRASELGEPQDLGPEHGT